MSPGRSGPQPDPNVVQGLLDELRRLRVENARLQQELDEKQKPAAPESGAWEREARSLRSRLHDAEAERDRLQEGIHDLVTHLRRLLAART